MTSLATFSAVLASPEGTDIAGDMLGDRGLLRRREPGSLSMLVEVDGAVSRGAMMCRESRSQVTKF